MTGLRRNESVAEWTARVDARHERILAALAAQWLAAGHSKVGMKALAERCRWESGIQTTGEPWRINNSHVAFYARLLIERRPEWADAIDTRRALADST